jgi:hypothetical protein
MDQRASTVSDCRLALETSDWFHRHRHSTLAMRRKQFFMTLTACLIAGKYSVSRNSSRVPTLHGSHLAVHFARLSDHYRERRRTQRYRHKHEGIVYLIASFLLSTDYTD